MNLIDTKIIDPIVVPDPQRRTNHRDGVANNSPIHLHEWSISPNRHTVRRYWGLIFRVRCVCLVMFK